MYKEEKQQFLFSFTVVHVFQQIFCSIYVINHSRIEKKFIILDIFLLINTLESRGF